MLFKNKLWQIQVVRSVLSRLKGPFGTFSTGLFNRHYFVCFFSDKLIDRVNHLFGVGRIWVRREYLGIYLIKYKLTAKLNLYNSK